MKATLKVVEFDGGDKRSQAEVRFEVVCGDITVHGIVLEDEGNVEFRYARKGNVILHNITVIAVEDSWIGRKHPGCEFVKADENVFEAIRDLDFGDHPMAEPINGRYLPRAFAHWEKEMEAAPREFEVDLDLAAFNFPS